MSHWDEEVKKINITFINKMNMAMSNKDKARGYVDLLQAQLDNIISLSKILRKLPWQEQIDFCVQNEYGSSLLMYLDKEQQLAYKLMK